MSSHLDVQRRSICKYIYIDETSFILKKLKKNN